MNISTFSAHTWKKGNGKIVKENFKNNNTKRMKDSVYIVSIKALLLWPMLHTIKITKGIFTLDQSISTVVYRKKTLEEYGNHYYRHHHEHDGSSIIPQSCSQDHE